MISTKGIRILTHTRALSTIFPRRPVLASHCRDGTQGLNTAIKGLVGTARSQALSSDVSQQKNTPNTTSAFIGTRRRLPEFSLADKVVLVSGAARGLGLVQAEALLEAGAIVYALDRLETPSPDFARVQKRATEELGTKFEYRRIDVTDSTGLNEIVERIADEHGRMDGLIAAAGIQQETPALEYTAADAK
jgi:short chain dehydrogenase